MYIDGVRFSAPEKRENLDVDNLQQSLSCGLFIALWPMDIEYRRTSSQTKKTAVSSPQHFAPLVARKAALIFPYSTRATRAPVLLGPAKFHFPSSLRWLALLSLRLSRHYLHRPYSRAPHDARKVHTTVVDYHLSLYFYNTPRSIDYRETR